MAYENGKINILAGFTVQDDPLMAAESVYYEDGSADGSDVQTALTALEQRPAISGMAGAIGGYVLTVESDKKTISPQAPTVELDTDLTKNQAAQGKAVGDKLNTKVTFPGDVDDRKGKYLAFDGTTGAPIATNTVADLDVIQTAINTYCTEHGIADVQPAVIDAGLTEAGYAADAKAAGDAVRSVVISCPNFAIRTAYAVGTKVQYNGLIYRVTTAIPASNTSYYPGSSDRFTLLDTNEYNQIWINPDDADSSYAASIEDIANMYVPGTIYRKGDYVYYDNNGIKLYRFNADYGGAAFNASYVTEVQVGSEVSDLKSAFVFDTEAITGSMPLVFKSGDYVTPTTTGSGETATYNPNPNYVCTVFPCSAGDVFNLHIYGPSGTSRAYFYCDENLVVIQRSATNLEINGALTVPDDQNIAYVIFNHSLSRFNEGYYAYKGRALLPNAMINSGSLTENDDLNDAVKQGYYWWASSHTPVNAPYNNTCIMLVLRRLDTSLVQVLFSVANNYTPMYRCCNNGTWSEWITIATMDNVSGLIAELEEQASNIENIENNVYFPYTNFENGNISPSTGENAQTDTRPLRSDFIPIESFVSVNVDGIDAEGNKYSYQHFAYDAGYNYLGLGSSTYKDQVRTREDILADRPTTKYVRIKITGGSEAIVPMLDVDDLDSYGYKGYIRATPQSENNDRDTDIDIYELITSNSDGEGHYPETFNIQFDLSDKPKVLTIVSKYTGGMPTIRYEAVNPVSGFAFYSSPIYQLGGTREPTRKSWRLPMKSGAYTMGKIYFSVPAGTVLEVRDAEMREDQRNRYNDLGIKYHGHTGFMAPDNSAEAFQLGAEIGYNSMITIPKFTTNGTGICFHDDDNIGGSLRWIDGTAITGDDNRAISSYSYNYITENFKLKETPWGELHVPTLDEFFRICSLTGMAPIMSVHSAGFGMSWDDGFREIRRLATKWNVLHKLSIKGGSTIMGSARNIFGTDIESYIYLSSQSYAPYDQLTLAKNAGFVDNDATDLSDCEYNLVSEYFYTQTTESGTYYTETMASIATELARGFKISVATTGAYGISGPEMERLIGLGVTEFTVDHHISMGLEW